MRTSAVRRVVVFSLLAVGATVVRPTAAENWYENSFWLLHEDHHTRGEFEVGRDADLEEISRLVGLCRPDMIQIHAKGNPGWTTYPTEIGHAPPGLARDVLGIWRDVARADGYHWSVYYNIGRDGEIMQRRPEWNRVQADGRPVERALCYHSGVAEEYLWPMIREIMQGYHPDGFWFDGSCFTIRPCYCKKCESRFRDERGIDPSTSPNQPGWNDYQRMQRRIYREFVHDTAAIIHELDADCLVAVNWAYSLRMPERPDAGIDYLTGDIGNRVEGLSAEAHWSDSQGLPFDLMTQINTLQTVAGPEGRPPTLQMRPKPAVQIEQEMAVIVANGGRYFAWDSPTPTSGLTPERFEFMAGVCEPFLKSRREFCLGSTRLPDVSLLHDATAHYAVADQVQPSFHRPDNRIDGATATLTKHHLNYEMLPDWRLHKQDVRSGVVLVEHLKVLTPETTRALVEHVARGGTLLVTGMTPHGNQRMSELLGLTATGGARQSESLTARLDGRRLAFSHWLFRLELAAADELLSVEDSDGVSHPLLTRNEYGRGQAFFVPLPLLTSHGADVVPTEVVRRILDHVSPPKSRECTIDAPDTVEMVLRTKGEQRILHLVNMAPGQRETLTSANRRHTRITSLPAVAEVRVSLKLPSRPTSVRLQPQDVSLEGWTYDNGRLEFAVPGFAVHQMVVIK